MIMGTKENVEKYLEDDDTKKLFGKIYEKFKEKGIDGIKECLEEEKKKIEEEFENIEKNIKKQIGG